MAKLKVTFVCLEWPRDAHTGGVARYAFRLAEAMRSEVELTVVTFNGGETLDGVTMLFIKPPAGRFSRFYVAPMTLRKAVASVDSDVIHSFGDDWALRRTAPLVRTFLGSSLSEARSSSGLRKFNHYVLAVTEKRSARRADVRVGIGPDSFDAFDCDVLMPPVVEVEVPKVVAKTQMPSVIFIGSHGGRKRGWLVDSAVHQARQVFSGEVQLTVIGPSDDRKNWPESTRHISGASDDVVRQLVADSWVLMAPSEYEGFGIPLFEAMSLGTAAIATPNPGSNYLRSLIEEPSAVSIHDPAELDNALIGRLTTGPELTQTESHSLRAAVDTVLHHSSARKLMADVYFPLTKN